MIIIIIIAYYFWHKNKSIAPVQMPGGGVGSGSGVGKPTGTGTTTNFSGGNPTISATHTLVAKLATGNLQAQAAGVQYGLPALNRSNFTSSSKAIIQALIKYGNLDNANSLAASFNNALALNNTDYIMNAIWPPAMNELKNQSLVKAGRYNTLDRTSYESLINAYYPTTPLTSAASYKGANSILTNPVTYINPPVATPSFGGIIAMVEQPTITGATEINIDAITARALYLFYLLNTAPNYGVSAPPPGTINVTNMLAKFV